MCLRCSHREEGDSGGSDRLLQRPQRPQGQQHRPLGHRHRAHDQGKLLLVHETDNDLWALRGGGMDVGESMADTVVREVREETGIDVEVTGVVGIYTNPTT
jgi:ADP-ribose pyrophosphatase YjhB (NUDIX family)